MVKYPRTYRLVDTTRKGNHGLTAATVELAKAGIGRLRIYPDSIIIVEATDWDDNLKPYRTITVERL